MGNGQPIGESRHSPRPLIAASERGTELGGPGGEGATRSCGTSKRATDTPARAPSGACVPRPGKCPAGSRAPTRIRGARVRCCPYRKPKSAASLGSFVKHSAFAQCVDGEDHSVIASRSDSAGGRSRPRLRLRADRPRTGASGGARVAVVEPTEMRDRAHGRSARLDRARLRRIPIQRLMAARLVVSTRRTDAEDRGDALRSTR